MFSNTSSVGHNGIDVMHTDISNSMDIRGSRLVGWVDLSPHLTLTFDVNLN